jgi:hypothetical protein
MPGKMPGKSVGRPAQGNNRGFREDPKWNPKPQAGPPVKSSGSVSKPKPPTPKWNPKPQPGPGRIHNAGPGV